MHALERELDNLLLAQSAVLESFEANLLRQDVLPCELHIRVDLSPSELHLHPDTIG